MKKLTKKSSLHLKLLWNFLIRYVASIEYHIILTKTYTTNIKTIEFFFNYLII